MERTRSSRATSSRAARVRGTRWLAFILALGAASCNRAPSEEQALAAIRASRPALETTSVVVRVWRDGPPWFSCAEVLAKLHSASDSSVIRDALPNWRGLLFAEWAVLRDTAAGPVVDPGWCTVKPLTDSMGTTRGWVPFDGPLFPTGSPRRAWVVSVGTRRLMLRTAPHSRARDTAVVEYVLPLSPNANGIALGSAGDSLPHEAVLARTASAWRLIHDRRLAIVRRQ